MGKNKNDEDDLNQEGNQKQQAVVLCDGVFASKVTADESYQSFGLKPWSLEASTKSKILCPINNVPLIDYILDFLASNGVEQVILVIGSCGGNDTALEDFLKGYAASSKKYSSLELLFLKDTSLINAGDALRELYKRNWIRASKQAKPFLLVSGDVVADLDLRSAMKAHQQRNQHDSAAVMTVVLKPVASTKSSKPSIVPRASDLIVGLVRASAKTAATVDAQGSESKHEEDDHRKDYRIMYYDNGSNQKASTRLPCSFLNQCQSPQDGLVVRHDLMDTGISICSPDVLGRLEDEFDYLDLAHDFVTNSVAEEEDGLQTRIYAHLLEAADGTSSAMRNYAARAVDFQTYHAISKDLLQRWAYPTVADRMLLTVGASDQNGKDSERRYKLVKVTDHHLHKVPYHRQSNWARRLNESGSRPRPFKSSENALTDQSSRTKNIDNGTIHRHNNYYQYKEILHPTKVGRTTIVHGPGMMGSHGSVGEECLLERCVLGDRVTIGDNAKLSDSHIMDGVVIESGARLESCLIAKNAVIKEGAVLEKGCVIGEGCTIGTGVCVPAFTRITLAKDDDDDDWGDDDDGYSESDDNRSDEEAAVNASDSGGENDNDIVGSDGKGRVWKPFLDDDDYSVGDEPEADGNDPIETLLQLQSIGGDPTAYYHRKELELLAKEAEEFEDDGFSIDDEAEDDAMLEEANAFNDFTGGTVTFGDDEYDNLNYAGGAVEEMVIGRQKGIDVVKEMTEICMEFDDECHPIENLSIELNSFKFSQNATYSDCASACLLALLRKMEVSPAMSDGRLVSLLKAKLDKFWTGMLQKLCRGLEEELAVLNTLVHAATIDQQPQSSSSTNDPDAIDNIQTATEIAEKLRSGMAFRFCLQTLHDQEVLSEESILAWANEQRNFDGSDDDPKQAIFNMQPVQDFLEWLEDDESDSDDGSDQSGSDSDDSD